MGDQQRAVYLRRVLRSSVGMVDATFRRRAAPNGCFQRSHGDAGVHGSTNRVADDLARPGVKDGGEIDEAAGDGDIGQVRNQGNRLKLRVTNERRAESVVIL